MTPEDRPGDRKEEALLFQEFPSTDHARWLAEARRVLEGADPLEALRTLLPEGIALEPIYFPGHAEGLDFPRVPPGAPPFARGRAPVEGVQALRPPLVTPEVRASSPVEAAERIAEEREGGAGGAWIPFRAPGGDAAFPGRRELPFPGPEALQALLEPVDPAAFPLFLDGPGGWAALFDRYAAAARARGVNPERLPGAVCADPLGVLALYGELPGSLEEAFREAGEVTARAAAEAPSLGTLWFHGELFHEAGADAVQELGFTLAAAVDTLRVLAAEGVGPATAAPHVRFSYGVGPRIFVETAKLRAARLLWNRVLEACGVPPERRGARIVARAAQYHMTRYHAHLNLLRAALGSFAALAGGAEGVCVPPHDLLLGGGDGHSRRLARNIPLILCEEARLASVADPGGGAWFLERLTGELARAAWKEFQAVEAEGGMARALAAGRPQEAVARRAEERLAGARTGKVVVVGVNRFPDPTETLPGPGAEAPGPPSACRVRPLPPRRLAAPFEALRSRVEAARQAGRDLRVLLLPLGPPARCFARLDFTAAFFHAGGFAVERVEDPPPGPGEGAALVAASGAPVAAFAGREEDYGEILPSLLRALRSGGRPPVTALAARRWEGEGVDFLVHEAADILEVLEGILAAVEEKP